MKRLILSLFFLFPFFVFSQTPGCTDSTATNYNPLATIDDSSCIYSCTADINIISPILCNGTFATIQVVASGGIGWYNYVLSYEASGNWYSLAQQYSYDTATFSTLPLGTYMVTITDTLGCSAQDTITITEPPFLSITTTQTNVSCIGSSDGIATVIPNGGTPPYTYNWNNGATTQTIIGLSSGSYNATVQDANGCTNNTTLNLAIIYSNTSNTINVTACNSYIWMGATYTQGGIYTDTSVNVNGCLHIDSLVLTINNSISNTISASACNDYIWMGTTYATSGTYTNIYTNTAGCDSMVTLILTINNTSSSEIRTECDTYTWNGMTYTKSGIYSQSSSVSLGDFYQGGVVFYLDSLGGGLVADISDLGTYQWGCYLTNIPGSSSTAIGTGEQNTLDILNGCAQPGIAARICNNSTNGGYSDWYLPSRDELYEMYVNRSIIDSLSIVHGGSLFSLSQYWSSSEYSNQYAFFQHFGSSNQNSDTKSDFHFVRAIRNFSTIPYNNIGCDSVANLNLTINYSYIDTSTIAACDLFNWNGQIITVSGLYSQTFTSLSGCDSTKTLNITIRNSTSTSTSIITCDDYTWLGTTYTTSGIYTDTSTNTNGCIHIDSLVLTIYDISSFFWVTACDNYTWNGTTYTQSGTYIWNGINNLGCDSVATLYLTINNSRDTTLYKSSCYNYAWQGSTYNSSGVYYDTLSSYLGCDSILQLVLVIHNNIVTHNNVTSCDNYTWNGITYTQSGNYVWNGTTILGCDSTAFLHLIINNSPSSSTSSFIVCDSMLWNGVTYTTSGVYTYTTQNTVGCDSIVTLNLIVNSGNKIIDTVSICYGESYAVENSLYTTTGSYLDTVNTTNGCLSTITTHLTVEDSLIVNINQSTFYLNLSVLGGVSPYTYLWNTGSINYVITPPANATYWVIVTDSMLCVADTVFFTVTNLSTDIFDNTISDISIYPNPSDGLINIDFNVTSALDLEIRINNIIGEQLFFNKLKSFKGSYLKMIDISNYSKGIYFLNIETENKMIKKKIIIQ